MAQRRWEDQHAAAVTGLEATKAAYEAHIGPLLRDALRAKEESDALFTAARQMVLKRSRLQAMAAGASTERREGSVQRSRSRARTEGANNRLHSNNNNNNKWLHNDQW